MATHQVPRGSSHVVLPGVQGNKRESHQDVYDTSDSDCTSLGSPPAPHVDEDPSCPQRSYNNKIDDPPFNPFTLAVCTAHCETKSEENCQQRHAEEQADSATGSGVVGQSFHLAMTRVILTVIISFPLSILPAHRVPGAGGKRARSAFRWAEAAQAVRTVVCCVLTLRCLSARAV